MVYIPPHTSYELYPDPLHSCYHLMKKTVTNNVDDHARAYTLTVWIVFDRHAEATVFFVLLLAI